MTNEYTFFNFRINTKIYSSLKRHDIFVSLHNQRTKIENAEEFQKWKNKEMNLSYKFQNK